ncbi:hypothetical protein ACGE24_03010 [Corynebacterium kroppenstedtii]
MSVISFYMSADADIRSTDRVGLAGGSLWTVNGRSADGRTLSLGAGLEVRLAEMTADEV